MSMILYGTSTSPFARRILVLTAETKTPMQWVDTNTEAGTAALKKATPLWKIPVAEIDGRIIFDSRAIIEYIVATRSWGELAPPRDAIQLSNLLYAIDEACSSAISVFYWKRDGAPIADIAYAQKQMARVRSIFDWLSTQIDQGQFGNEWGMAEVSLLCTLDWMQFRDAFPTAEYDASFGPLRQRYGSRPSLVATAPRG